MEVFLWVVGIIIFLLVISISVGLHEASHMFFGKVFKLDAPKFFIGFGPTLKSFKTSKTEYGVKAIPLGGFVTIEDSNASNDSVEKTLLSNVHPLKRIVIYSAGAVMNLVLGVIILVSMMLVFPVPQTGTTVNSVLDCNDEKVESCVASKAGVLAGDKIIAVNNKPVNMFDEVMPFLESTENFTLTVERNGNVVDLIVVPENGKLGVYMEQEQMKVGLIGAFKMTGSVINQNLNALATLPAKIPNVIEVIGGGERDPEGLSSVVTVGKAYGDITSEGTYAVDHKVQMLWTYAGLVNLGLGLVNLLPIMPLDGGRIFISFIDLMKLWSSRLTRKVYKPVGPNFIGSMTAVTGAMVIGFMFLLIVADLVSPVNVIG